MKLPAAVAVAVRAVDARPCSGVMQRAKLWLLPLFQPLQQHLVTAELPAPRSGVTLYTRFGDWVVWLCWALLGGLYVATLGGVQRVRGQRRTGSQRDSRDPGRAEDARGPGPGTPEASLTSTENSER